MMNLPNRPKGKATPKPHVSISKLIEESSHVNYEDLPLNKLRCVRCKASLNRMDPQAKHWLSSQCIAMGTSADRPIPVRSNVIHMNRRASHHTHKLFCYRGLVYCNICGCRATNQLRDLGNPCEPPTSYGLQSLTNIRRGKKPPNLTAWPDQDSASMPKASSDHVSG